MGTTGTTWLVISASVVAARTTISIASSAIARWTVTACGTITSVTAITSIATVTTVTAIATIFLGELLGHRFKWLVVSDESNLFNFVNFDATLGDADDRDAINVEFCFGFDNISGL
jgi:hypothetical protein